MIYHIDKINLPKQVFQAISLVENLFPKKILGIYLYGSATLGGLYPNSDIDILIITSKKINNKTRTELTKQLMAISGKVGCIEKRPLEVTIINQKDIISWQLPLKCEYMYGEWLRKEMEAGKIPQPFYDADLTILLWQARVSNIQLRGEQAEKLIPLISSDDVQKAIQDSLPILLSNIKNDETNILLTLSRMWFTLETGQICSKNTAAEWILPKLPSQLTPLMELAVAEYLGKCTAEWNDLEKEVFLLIDFIESKLKNILECSY